MGFYYKNFLENPTRLQGNKSKLSYYREIENYIFDNIGDGARKVTSQARTTKQGRTEWIYSDQQTIDDVFKLASKKYGGKLKSYKLTKALFKKETHDNQPFFQAKINFS